MLVDSHCHLDRLDLTPFDGSLPKAIQAAIDAGVTQCLCVSINSENQQAVIKIAEEYDNIHASVGVHPLYTKGETASIESLAKIAAHPKVVAIGETGLDYFYDAESKQQQITLFRTHIQAAVEVDLPLIIHTRDARQDTLSLLKTEGADKVGGVLHCFTESLQMAEEAMDMGFYVSFSGIVTFNNADELRQVAKAIPLDRILVETDSPYLTPKPFRGKPNSPRHVLQVAELIAKERQMDLQEFAQITTQNYHRLFKIPTK